MKQETSDTQQSNFESEANSVLRGQEIDKETSQSEKIATDTLRYRLVNAGVLPWYFLI